jgi:hypothetical protein
METFFLTLLISEWKCRKNKGLAAIIFKRKLEQSFRYFTPSFSKIIILIIEKTNDSVKNNRITAFNLLFEIIFKFKRCLLKIQRLCRDWNHLKAKNLSVYFLTKRFFAVWNLIDIRLKKVCKYIFLSESLKHNK